MTKPRISVVIANYNYGRFLRDAIDSVLAQRYENLEVLVVDDGSTDESRSILESYRGRVRPVLQENRGVSAARNRGIAESTSPLIAFLDSDDLWHPDKLERQVEQLDDPDVGMVYTGLRYIDSNGRELGRTLLGSSGNVLEELVLLRGPGVPASGSGALIRREVFERVGLFDTSLSTSADWDMWRRIACHYAIELVREPLVFYRQHGDGMHTHVEVLERDMVRAFESTFADPAARAVHRLERRCYGNLYLMLAGSYLHAGEVERAIRSAARAIKVWPASIAYVLETPLRRFARRLGLRERPHGVGTSPRPQSMDS